MWRDFWVIVLFWYDLNEWAMVGNWLERSTHSERCRVQFLLRSSCVDFAYSPRQDAHHADIMIIARVP